MAIKLPSSKPQAMVAASLDQLRKLFLHEALANAIRSIELKVLNEELDRFAPKEDLQLLAARSIRGEFVFAVPHLLRQKPHLLGYYRLLLGYSQKLFYSQAKLGRFKCLEFAGHVTPKIAEELEELCHSLNSEISKLLTTIGFEKVSLDLVKELTLLTLGPQLRGGNNTQIGKLANRAVFEIIQQIVGTSVTAITDTSLEILNAAQRRVVISFSADPDISIREELSPGKLRDVVAIEIKGGTDQSNIWNRLGEAEKSHQSAKKRGFVQFWTIFNVETLDLAKAREKSPTTQKFFNLRELTRSESSQFGEFQEQLTALLGIRHREP
jgi:hypothetical protein